jgi:hypothetical protein
MEAAKSLEATRKGLPGVWGAERPERVAAGTGEALPGPAACGFVAAGAWRPITGDPGKWIAGRVGAGGGRSTGRAAGQHNLR